MIKINGHSKVIYFEDGIIVTIYFDEEVVRIQNHNNQNEVKVSFSVIREINNSIAFTTKAGNDWLEKNHD